MDYSKATNQQLYEIAINESLRMIDRYEAVREFQKRKSNRGVYKND